MKKWIIHRKFDLALNLDNLYILQHDDAQRTLSILRSPVAETLPDGVSFPDFPFISSHAWLPRSDVMDFLQAAMDAAFEAGLRPTGHRDMSAELKAVRYHLEDLRSLSGVKKDGGQST